MSAACKASDSEAQVSRWVARLLLLLNECSLGVCGGFSSILPERPMASNVSVVNATAKSIGDDGRARDGDGDRGRDGAAGAAAGCGPRHGMERGRGGLATVADART